MDDTRFWAIIGKAYRADLLEQAEALAEGLGSLNWLEVLEFQALFDSKVFAVNTPELRAAAVIVNGDDSDAGFRNFALGLVSLGQRAYEAALANADSLADFVESDPLDGYGLDKVAMRVYESKTGGSDFYERLARQFSPPTTSGKITSVIERDSANVLQRFPRLTRLYGSSDEGQS